MKRVLIADPDARARLRALGALRAHFEVFSTQLGEDPVRASRHHRPDVVLLAMPRARMTEAMRTCKRIKTEPGQTPPVGLLDRWRRLTVPETALEGCLGDGYLAGRAEPQDIVDFVNALLEGEQPIVMRPAELGLIGRIVGRNFP